MTQKEIITKTNIMEKQFLKFESVKEMVNWLLDNEGVILNDCYGRRWFYEEYNFRYEDISGYGFDLCKIDCLHLFKTDFYFYI